MMTPEKGDKVRVTFEGEYSHQGSKNLFGNGPTGFHVVEVPGKLGWHKAQVPPNATVEVVGKALPPEPPDGAIVTLDAQVPCSLYSLYYRTGERWLAVGTSGPYYSWRELNETKAPIRRVYVDPLADAPELPYIAKVSDNNSFGSRELWVDIGFQGDILIGAARFTKPEATRVAKAILAYTGGLE